MRNHDREDRQDRFENSPTGPSVAPARPLAPPPVAIVRRRPIWSAIVFALLILGIGVRANRDLSRPEAWAYWKESYLSPGMTSSVVATLRKLRDREQKKTHSLQIL